ncbi:MAG: hypothetical protein E7497_01150 [Ruminococcus sp.]|nr:hypothetical protein [Ruminococcus sp.]
MKMKVRRILHVVPLVISAICVLMVIVFIINAIRIYCNGHKIEHDKTSSINVLLTRPENWRKIETGKITLTMEDISLIDGSTATIPITAELARQFCGASDENINDYIDHNTTHYAYENLIHTEKKNRNCPEKRIIFATEPSEYELEYVEKLGLELEVTPIAMDGFVFITHKGNPIDSLTVEQIQKIYSGEITNWKDVGGNDAEIIPYQRERNSGSQTAMEQLVMKDVPLMKPAVGYCVSTGMDALIEKVAEYENYESSIGYTYYYYTNNLYKNEDIKVLKIDGITPDNENLVNRSYPFTTAYYAVIIKGYEGKHKELRDYLLTDEGQEIIELAGYCPINAEVK